MKVLSNSEHFILTKEHIEKAVTYMPIFDKQVYAKKIAKLSTHTTKTAEQNKVGEKFLAFPTLIQEDCAVKNMALLSVFLTFYFDVEIDGDITDSTYDFYAVGHPYNVLEKYKSDKDLKHKVFEIIEDFKEFRRMVDVEISNIKELNNDSLARFSASVQVMSSPENIKAMIDELKSVSDEYLKKVEELKENKNG